MSASELTAGVATDLGTLEPLEEGWRRLAEERGSAFVTPEWYRCWLAAYDGGTPMVAFAHDRAGRLRGVLPLAREGGGTLRFGGANLADRFHPACSAEDEAAVAAACGQVLAREPWSTLVLDYVDRAAAWPGALAEAGRSTASSGPYRGASLPFVDLGEFADWDSYLAGRSRNMRSQLRRYERRLEREHRVAFRRTTDAAQLDADLDAFFRLHYARWEGRGGSSSGSEAARTFHRRFSREALERGWLRLWLLELDGETVAAWYGWKVGSSYSYYLAGFDPARSELRPGHVLLAHTIRTAIAEGASEYDMLLGEEAYKERFATGRREVHTIIVTRTLPARVRAGIEVGSWRAARRLPDRLRDGLASRLAGVRRLLPGSRRR